MLVMLFNGTASHDGPHASGERWRASGLEAWTATSLTRSAVLLEELLTFSFEGEIAAPQFDIDIDRYEKASRENFPNNASALPCACCWTDR